MLPTIQHPKFNCTLPDSGIDVSYRPFLHGEGKILLMAKESSDEKEIEEAVINIIERCTEGQITKDIKLSDIDLEYMFLKLRISSKGETTTIGVKCRHHTERDEMIHPVHGNIPAYSGPCDTVNEIQIDLAKIVAFVPTKEERIIKITDNIGMEMNYPSREDIAELTKAKTENDVMNLVYKCINTIYCGSDLFSISELDDPKTELDEFFEQFNDEQIKKVTSFFSNQPCLKLDVEFTCKSCGHKDVVKLRGLSDFF